jgi:hypothetical protein
MNIIRRFTELSIDKFNPTMIDYFQLDKDLDIEVVRYHD